MSVRARPGEGYRHLDLAGGAGSGSSTTRTSASTRTRAPAAGIDEIMRRPNVWGPTTTSTRRRCAAPPSHRRPRRQLRRPGHLLRYYTYFILMAIMIDREPYVTQTARERAQNAFRARDVGKENQAVAALSRRRQRARSTAESCTYGFQDTLCSATSRAATTSAAPLPRPRRRRLRLRLQASRQPCRRRRSPGG